jgi:hypothetical protein
VDLTGESDENASASHTLLIALNGVFGTNEKMFSKDIVAALNSNEELSFGAWNDGKGIKARARPAAEALSNQAAEGPDRGHGPPGLPPRAVRDRVGSIREQFVRNTQNIPTNTGDSGSRRAGTKHRMFRPTKRPKPG